jgi:hypothetical protein
MYRPGIGSLRAAGQIVICMIRNYIILIHDIKVEKNRIHLLKGILRPGSVWLHTVLYLSIIIIEA